MFISLVLKGLAQAFSAVKKGLAEISCSGDFTTKINGF